MRAGLRIILAAAVLMGSLGATCKNTAVTIPPAAQDKPPEIKLSNFMIAGSGIAQPAEVSSANGPTASATIGPSGKTCEIPRVMFIGGASNPIGGVESLRVVVRRPALSSPIAYDVTVTATPGSDGKVSTGIPLLGHNGAGGPGDKPLQIMFEGGKRGCPTNETIVVELTARNFNNQVTTLIETLTAPDLSSEGCICE
jgi:hypothetical protein